VKVGKRFCKVTQFIVKKIAFFPASKMRYRFLCDTLCAKYNGPYLNGATPVPVQIKKILFDLIRCEYSCAQEKQFRSNGYLVKR
jgi:hypothetical protein